MNHEIICEDFSLTDAIRSHVDTIIVKLQENSDKPLRFHVFLSKNGPGEFKAAIETRLHNKELYAQASNQDLYQAATQAKKNLKKQIIELHRLKIDHHS